MLIELAVQKADDAAFRSSRPLTKGSLEKMSQKWQVKLVRRSHAGLEVMKKASAQPQDEIAKQDDVCARAIAKLRQVEGASDKQ